MAKISRQVDKLFLNLSGIAARDLICVGARIRSELSKIPEMRMEFFSKDTAFDPKNVLGTQLKLEADNGFAFSGIVVSVEDLGHQDGIDLFAAEVRPSPWLLTIGSQNRIFQGMTTPEIIKKVFAAEGASSVTLKTTASYKPREYCVQYGESNWDFVSRLMEEDGIYHYWDASGTGSIVLADSVSAHSNKGTVKFSTSNQVGERHANSDSIFEWADATRVVTGIVSLFDYDMELPNADLKVKSAVPKGKHAYKDIERYQATGHYKTADIGTAQARIRAEAHAAEAERVKGVGNSATVMTGGIFTFEHENRTSANGDYLVTRATYYMQYEPGYSTEHRQSLNRQTERIKYPADMGLFEVEFEAQKSSVPFRPPALTPWPEVPSLLTAKVTGPEGEEIYTDEYGRIKVIFPWDRLGEPKETSSCWVRSVLPWTGKDYGWQSIPRVGMEVIIQFERGNIDRPYCTGMVYNGVNKPPYALPGEMTKTGIRTNASKGGEGFHELTFDDKKGAENIFFQSEKDYKQVIKNNAEITIGLEKKDKGSLTQTIHQDKIETIKEGDSKLTIEKGNRITNIKTDDTSTIEGKSTTTITGDTALTVKTGNLTETVKTGNATTEVSTGNLATKVSLGNITIEAAAGKVSISAAQAIELKVGGSTLTVDVTGITLKGAMLTLDAQAMAEIKATMTTVKGNAMVQVSGGIVMVG